MMCIKTIYAGAEASIDENSAENGIVRINHAGMSIIRATLSDPNGDYADASAYVLIDIKRKDLTVSSHAYKKDTTEVPDDLVYGYIDNSVIDYSLSFSGFVSGDSEENFTRGHGTLEAVPLPVNTGAGTAQEIGIKRCGTGSGPDASLFFSRDYRIIEKRGTVSIGKAKINIDVDAASGVYGDKEPAYSWSIEDEQPQGGGPAAWDSEAAVFAKGKGPEITRRGPAAKADHRDLDARTYENGLGVKDADRGVSPNYDPSFGTGDLTVEPADISRIIWKNSAKESIR